MTPASTTLRRWARWLVKMPPALWPPAKTRAGSTPCAEIAPAQQVEREAVVAHVSLHREAARQVHAQAEARVPVFAHLEGICHVYADGDADLE
jgi:hypothetical protein